MAGTVTVSKDVMSQNQDVREVTVACVADAAAATFPDTNLANLSGLVHGPLTGWGLWMVETDPGATGPTDNSDLTLESEGGTDLLGGNGTDGIDNAANNLIYPPVSPMPIGTTLTQKIANNAVNSAGVTIKYYLAR